MSNIDINSTTQQALVKENSFQHWQQLMVQVFYDAANDIDHVEPVFNEAAEGSGDEDGGAKWHKKDIIGLPAAKFHAMTGQMESSHDVRRARMEGKNFRNQVLDRADYYGAFEKYNNFTI